jgi:hypothetical protein
MLKLVLIKCKMDKKPLTVETVKKYIEFSKKTIKLFMDYDRKSFVKNANYDKEIKQHLSVINNIHITAVMLLRGLDSSSIRADVREQFKVEVAEIVQTTNEILRNRRSLS